MVVNIVDLLLTAQENGIQVILDDGRLQLKLPRNRNVDNMLLEHIKQNEEAIIDLIRKGGWNLEKVNHATSSNVIETNSIQHIPLSFSQERLWFIDRMEGSVQYHVAAAVRLKGSLDKEVLNRSFQAIINRHEILRSVFIEANGVCYQSLKDKHEWQLGIVDGSGCKGDRQSLQAYMQQLIKKPFDLSNDHMLRADLIQLSEQEYVLVLTMHQIASDGWSISILIKELVEFYSTITESREATLPELQMRYADYAISQRKLLQGEVLNEKLSYWQKKLEGVAPLQLPTDFARGAVYSSTGDVRHFRISKEVSEELKVLSKQEGTTLFMTLMSAFMVLMYRYCNQPDICIGTVVGGRHRPELENVVGFFDNTLALRSEVNGDATFRELLGEIKATILEAYEHRELPFEKVVESVVKERTFSRTPLFQVMFVLQDIPEIPQLHFGEVELSREVISYNTSKFDISFFLRETSDGLQGSVEYCRDLYERETIDRMMGHYNKLLCSVIKAPCERIGILDMLTEQEEHQLLHTFNNTEADYPRDKTIVELFEEQVDRTPNNEALIFDDRKLSYRQLNERANQLGHYLRRKGVREDSLVPICIDRSLEMIIGILGILKAGAAYVPIDSEYPVERIEYMLKDTGAATVVCNKEAISKLQAKEGIEVIRIDEMSIDEESTNNLSIVTGSSSLVYVIYTSGSTGIPKGVEMANSSLVNLLTWQEKEFNKKFRRVLQFTSLSFDVSFQEIFSTLCSGSVLNLIPADHCKDLSKLLKDIQKGGITTLFIPPVVFKTLAEHTRNISNLFFPVEEVIVAGEQLKLTEEIQKFIDDFSITLINQYGPTETHVVTSYHCRENFVSCPLPSIGKPISNARIYILDKSGNLVPVGVLGEICIAGTPLAAGYLNLQGLTHERFVPYRYSKEPGDRIYKTGDIGRWSTDGNIHYVGRIDDQVKIHGYRIEPGEIESVLHQCKLVRQAVVIAKMDNRNNRRLVGYVIPASTFNEEEIISYLRSKLPRYMIPAFWMEVKSFPLTHNGKIDKKALPDPTTDNILTSAYIAPRTDVELKLMGIWKQLLQVDKIGIDENFFELGGNSILAIQLASAIRREFNVEVVIKNLFLHPSVRLLSTHLQVLKEGGKPTKLNGHDESIIPIQSNGAFPPFFAVHDSWVYVKLAKYLGQNQPFFCLEGCKLRKIEDMATYYISKIKKAQPLGPYYLGGFCENAVIAFEIAQQLIGEGEKVSLLALFDLYEPRVAKLRNPLIFLPKRLKFISKVLSKASLKEKLLYVKNEIFRISGGLLSKLKNLEPEKYSFRPYQGKVVLVKAIDNDHNLFHMEEPLMGWSEYFTGEVDLLEVDGHHFSIFEEPGVVQVAQTLKTAMHHDSAT